MGMPQVHLELESDQPVAMVAVRLSDVAPDGEATRVTYGLLNLTHRDSDEKPEPMEPGRRYDVVVALNGIAQSFPAGHRLRISISTSYWPLAWTPPEPATLTLHTTGCHLELPVRPPRDEDANLRPFGPPEGSSPLEVTRLDPGEHHWRTTRDLVTGTSTLEIVDDQGVFRLEDTGTVMRRASNEWFSIRGNDVTTARGETRTERRLERGEWGVSVRTRTVLTCTPTTFEVNAQIDAYELYGAHGEPRVFSENWNRSIPRNLV